MQTPEKFRLIDRRFDPDGKMYFTFNKRLKDPSLKITYPAIGFDDKKIVDISPTKDTAMLYLRNMDFDSIRVAFFDGGKPLDTIYMRKGRKEAFSRLLTFQYNISNDGKLRPGSDLVLKASQPVDSFDPSLISLKEDSTDVTNFTVDRDSINPKIFKLKYRWKQIDNYTITLNEGAFTNIYGDKNKRTFKRFNVDKPENYSVLTLNVTVPDTAKSYIVELLNSEKRVLRSDVIHKNANIVYKNYITGKYTVRVTYDDNNNGVWDSGNVKKREQPENIWVDEAIITLRPNWEQVTPITIPKEQINP
jgi:hypothetical protein